MKIIDRIFLAPCPTAPGLTSFTIQHRIHVTILNLRLAWSRMLSAREKKKEKNVKHPKRTKKLHTWTNMRMHQPRAIFTNSKQDRKEHKRE